MHSLTPQRLQMLLGSPEAQRLSAAAQERLQRIAEFVMSGDSISQTCNRLGIARSTFHRWLDRFDPDDLSSLEERAHETLPMRGNTVTDEAAALIRTYRERSPLMGKERIRELLMLEHSMDVSASTIGRVIERECLYFGSTPLHWRKRMRHQADATADRQIQNISSSSTETQKTPVIDTTPEADVVPFVEPTTAFDAVESCACAWCRFWCHEKRHVRRYIGLASVLVNVAVAAMFFTTILWEKSNEPSVEAQLTHNESTATPPSISLSDGR